MIPSAINPTAQANCLSDMFGVEVTAIVATHHDVIGETLEKLERKVKTGILTIYYHTALCAFLKPK
jgi:hypothetical protein